MSRLGAYLEKLRGNLSLFDVQKGTGIHRFAVSKYETGKNIPPPDSMKKLAEFYEISLIELQKRYFEDLFFSSPEQKDAMTACVIENTPKEELLRLISQQDSQTNS